MRAIWKKTAIIAVLALALSGLPMALAGTAAGPQLSPPEVKITAFYNGTQVRVDGSVPQGHQAAVVLSSGAAEQSFRVKEKVGGVLWMNRATVSFDNLPMVYLLAASATGDAARDVDAALGLEHLRTEAHVQSNAQNHEQLFDEFAKMKQGEGLYSINYGALTLDQADSGIQTLHCDLEIPAKMPLGEFSVRLIDIDPQGRITEAGSKQLKVSESGLPALLSELAFEYGTLYGLLAVVIAICGGMVTSIIFRQGGGGAH